MNNQEKINKLIEEALNSADHVKRASPMPFLQTRLNARINKLNEDTWDKAGWFIGRPSIAIAGLALLIFINGMAVVFNRTDSSFSIATEQSTVDQADEFNYTVTTLYDNENIEP
jgi:hypothetical protein